MRKFSLVVLLLMTSLSVASCGRNQPLVNVEGASFQASESAALDQMTEAIVAAGTARGWVMEPQTPGNIKGEILVRNTHRVAVDIVYDTRDFSILYDSSDNMNYQLRDGTPRIHPSYMKWIKYLRQDIQFRTKRY